MCTIHTQVIVYLTAFKSQPSGIQAALAVNLTTAKPPILIQCMYK